MARGSTLAQVRLMVKGEVGDVLTAGINAQTDGLINRRIVQMQVWLSNEYKWPFMFGSFDVTVPAGQRFVTAPALNFDQMPMVATKYSTLWSPVSYGIGPREYNIFDSESQVVPADPILRWKEYMGAPPSSSNPADMQIEVWPVPATQQTLRFEGQRALQIAPTTTTLTDTMKLDLDDLMLAYYVAAQMQVGTPLGALLTSKAQSRFNLLRAQCATEFPTFSIGKVRTAPQPRETTVRINKVV